MSSRGVDFIHKWVDQNVTDAWRPASAEFVAALFRKCLAAADAQGITMTEIEEELGFDVRAIIFEALMNDPNEEFVAKIKDRLQ